MDGVNVLFACGFIGRWVWEVMNSRRKWDALNRRRTEVVMVLAAVLAGVALTFMPGETRGGLAEMLHQQAGLLVSLLLRLFLWGCLGLQALRLGGVLLERGIRPEVLLLLSFLVVTLASGFLLTAPKSAADPGRPIAPVDAVFTATSAVCVTGLTVRDTGSEFSEFGQAIILATIQIGGLGIISFVCLLASLSSKCLPIAQMVAFRQAFNTPASGDLRKQVLGVVAVVRSPRRAASRPRPSACLC